MNARVAQSGVVAAITAAYILFVEYVTVLLGPEFVRLAEQRCGIPRAALSVIANHVELDVAHVEEGVDAIDDLVEDPADLAPMQAVLKESIVWFDRLCAEVVDPAHVWTPAVDPSRPAA